MSESLASATDTRCVALVAALKAARHALGWSQADLAKLSGISRVTIGRMEAGMFMPRASTLEQLLKALEASGVAVQLGMPAGGFTLAVDGPALMPQEPGTKTPQAGSASPAQSAQIPEGDRKGTVDHSGGSENGGDQAPSSPHLQATD